MYRQYIQQIIHNYSLQVQSISVVSHTHSNLRKKMCTETSPSSVEVFE